MSKIEEIRAALEGATPGPWKIGIDLETYAGGVTDTSIAIGPDDFDPVALAINEHPEEDCRKSDVELGLNARLIALAPAMARIVLAAEKLAFWVDGMIEDGCPKCGGDCSSANPPVSYCPIRDAAGDLAAYRKAVEGKA